MRPPSARECAASSPDCWPIPRRANGWPRWVTCRACTPERSGSRKTPSRNGSASRRAALSRRESRDEQRGSLANCRSQAGAGRTGERDAATKVRVRRRSLGPHRRMRGVQQEEDGGAANETSGQRARRCLRAGGRSRRRAGDGEACASRRQPLRRRASSALRGQSNGQADAAPSSVDRTLASPGRPLEPALRQDMEQRFGHDFRPGARAFRGCRRTVGAGRERQRIHGGTQHRVRLGSVRAGDLRGTTVARARTDACGAAVGRSRCSGSAAPAPNRKRIDGT